MKKSIKIRLAVTYIGIMCISLAAMLAMNSLFLEKYYVERKKESLKKVYEALNNVDGYQYSALNEDSGFKKYLAEKNFLLIVVDPFGNRYSTTKDEGEMLAYMQFEAQFSRGQREIMEEKDNYVVTKITGDANTMDVVCMYGTLDDRSSFMVRTPIQSIRDSAQISNLFYLYIGLATILISSILIWIMSRRITKPLQTLSNISREMADLNFDVKYESAGQDEISVLGNNLNKLSEDLEKTISELKTANNELQQDIAKKEEIDEMRKEFLANVSHELKTPIALIQGYAEGLQECINDDAQSREFYCDVIIDEAGKMNNMVKKLLTLNQLEFGNDTITMERFDLTELVRGVVQSVQLLADQKEAKLHFALTEPVYVWGDEFKIEEVVTNYVSNALNHVDYEKKIEIKTEIRNDVVRISVFNTGDTIPEADLDKVWVKFYKVDKARTREYGGSGIGLSIVKAIMDSMHQKCGVKNYSNGVEFWFELSLAEGKKTECQKM
ncbi:sensor histidine kinase [Blautia argi]|uniref:histidine kinase n=1 Tax=Blautia argi TaxID=1912897 RepID=A0A2Z4UAD0_9FIRM|nr:HAMP domain-containing sensor histidine kinase [Blautia argi]AWY97824.1 two-component sensor histidine kinase [Blautia argi]